MAGNESLGSIERRSAHDRIWNLAKQAVEGETYQRKARQAGKEVHRPEIRTF